MMIYHAVKHDVFEGKQTKSLPWKSIPSTPLENYMGQKPEHFPKTSFKLFYTNVAIHLLFQVEDRYIRAIAKEQQGEVWKDSCVEFFFTPGHDITQGYFNLEVNCGGTMLFHFQERPGHNKKIIGANVCQQISPIHSLPVIVYPEIKTPTTWSIEYQIPFKILEKFTPIVQPRTGVNWRANFYKCADNCSHPHWLTWAPIDFPKPNFHLPEFFGTLYFQ